MSSPSNRATSAESLLISSTDDHTMDASNTQASNLPSTPVAQRFYGFGSDPPESSTTPTEAGSLQIPSRRLEKRKSDNDLSVHKDRAEERMIAMDTVGIRRELNQEMEAKMEQQRGEGKKLEPKGPRMRLRRLDGERYCCQCKRMGQAYIGLNKTYCRCKHLLCHGCSTG
jgi:hypothetical protein